MRSIPKRNTKNVPFWFTFSRQSRIWSFRVVVLQRTAKKCTKIHNARAQPLLSSLNLLFADVAVFFFCVKVLNILHWAPLKRLVQFVLLLFLFCSAKGYTVGQEEIIMLEIKPTSHTGVLLSSSSTKGDYIVLEMIDGNVSM